MASEIVNVPVCSIPWAFQHHAVEDLRVFMQMKLRNGRWIEDVDQYPKKTLNRLCRRKWLILHDGKYYQVKWESVFPLEGRHTHAKMGLEILEDPTLFKAMLFLIGYAYLMSPQVPRKPKSRVDYATQVKASRHNGGISHSICMRFFGFKKTWCRNMRRLCENLGLASWEDRWIPVELQKAHGTVPFYIAEQLMEGPGKFRITKDNVVVEQVTSKYTQNVQLGLHIPFEYRHTVKYVYS